MPAAPAHAIYIRADVPVDQYNAIGLLPQYAASAYLRFYNPGDTVDTISTGGCGGTLISATKILTAAHCFDKGATGTMARIASQVVGFTMTVPYGDTTTPSNIASVVNNPLWSSGDTKGKALHDVAIVTLTEAVTGIAPAVLFAGNPTGLMSAMIGYGSQGSGTLDTLPGANNRLGAYNTIDLATTTALEFDFDSPDGTSSSLGSATPLALEGSVAGGDSGSALWATVDGAFLVTGDLNGGAPLAGRPANQYGERNFYAPVANALNASFIIANAPDVTFDRRMLVNGRPTVGVIRDSEIVQNITKFGSVLNLEEFEEDIAVAAIEVPEPASLALLAVGVAGLVIGRRRPV